MKLSNGLSGCQCGWLNACFATSKYNKNQKVGVAELVASWLMVCCKFPVKEKKRALPFILYHF
jgi:hypothetical protein